MWLSSPHPLAAAPGGAEPVPHVGQEEAGAAPGPWATGGLGHSCSSTVQEHLVGGGCQDLTRLLPGVLVKWLLQWQAALWLGGISGIPPHPPLQMRNGISPQLCSATRAGWGVQTPLAEPSLLLLLLLSTQMECVSYGCTAKHSKHTQQLLFHL